MYRYVLIALLTLCFAPLALAGGPAHTARTPKAAQALSPSDGARVQAIPSFSWRAARHAEHYQFQLAADAGFRSVTKVGNIETKNLFASIEKRLPDGDYFWRVRGVDAKGRAGKWSATRRIAKRWTERPLQTAPADGATITFPSKPLVLDWEPVQHATRYEVAIASDPAMAQQVYRGGPVVTTGTTFAFPSTLPPGRYYWTARPLDAQGHRGSRSDIRSFNWVWPTQMEVAVDDLEADPRFMDPRFSWKAVPGAARYEVEVNFDQDFAAGSRVCCDDKAIGTSLSPQKLFPNNVYYWRVRAIDENDNSGVWNEGTPFSKQFDPVDPSIPNLRLADNLVDPAPSTTTSSPVVRWDPVAGASSYEVQMVPWTGGCDYTQNFKWGIPKPIETAGLAWTPLGAQEASPVPFPNKQISYEGAAPGVLNDGQQYCVRVRARQGTDTTNNRVVSDWTQLGGLGNPAFTYDQPAGPIVNTALYMEASDYTRPMFGSTTPRVPLFSWKNIQGACGYWVVVARDQFFTTVVDVARTQIAAYAPRLRSYPDETTAYYWAVLPVVGTPCEQTFTVPSQNNPRNFLKLSTPPTQIAPAVGAEAFGQPAFRWTPTEGAREYRLQVAADQTFSNIVDDVKTASTGFTPTGTYPADAELYWRVRVNDENFVGLGWSPKRGLVRRLAAPAWSFSPPVGERIPLLVWAPVEGATGYEIEVEKVDGDIKHFEIKSTAFTPTTFFGNGTWHWRVRALFPKATFGTNPGPYTPRKPFTRLINPPPGAHTLGTKTSVLATWDSSPAASKYRVEFSEGESFFRKLESKTVEGTSYAPKLTAKGFTDGGPVFYRVAAVDDGQNVGGFAVGQIGRKPRLKVVVRGTPRRGAKGTVKLKVTDGRGKPVGRARVTIRGLGVGQKRARTNKAGGARLKIRPRRRGRLVVRADKRGYTPTKVTIRVP